MRAGLSNEFRNRLTAVAREYGVVLLPGDGIGPEVISEAAKALQAVGQRFGLRFAFSEALIGGVAVDAAGIPLPAETIARCYRADAILLGAVGGPRWDRLSSDRRPEAGLLELRRALGVFANLRPVRALASLEGVSPLRPAVVAGTDLLIVRELIGGLYFGQPRGRHDGSALDTLRYTEEEIARVVRVALAAAQQRRRQLTSVDKANVLETSRLWREIVEKESRAFPGVAVRHMLVDTCAMNLVRAPAQFDVIVTENMFGDILSDEAGAVVGSLGVLPSASLGQHAPFLYEPVHGSAPDIAGRGIANPVGAILSIAMMLRHSLEDDTAAAVVEAAVAQVLKAGCRTADLGGDASTVEVGDRVAEAIATVHYFTEEEVGR